MNLSRWVKNAGAMVLLLSYLLLLCGLAIFAAFSVFDAIDGNISPLMLIVRIFAAVVVVSAATAGIYELTRCMND